MKWIIIGLGNPSDEYASTRHNVGKDIVASLKEKLPNNAKVVELNVYMNHSGPAIKKAISTAKGLVVVHDELDLPLGRVKISFGNSGGGHNGVKSIIGALKTQDFARVRIGVSPSTPRGKLKKPTGEKVTDFVLGKFKPPELEKLKKVKKVVLEALELIVEEGVEQAQTKINAA
ncbi:aminoacyl-tRNA hydrolase [Candidatus Parcubacteria bacterium]|nr:aminoacyl-tRNA hydrolase [Candidatus Parcubacteria bacterium]